MHHGDFISIRCIAESSYQSGAFQFDAFCRYLCITEISFQSDASQRAHINLVHFNLMHFVDIYASRRFHNPMHCRDFISIRCIAESSYQSGAFQSHAFCRYLYITEISFQPDASQRAHINLVHFNLMHFVDIYASQRFHFNPMHRRKLI